MISTYTLDVIVFILMVLLIGYEVILRPGQFLTIIFLSLTVIILLARLNAD